MGGKSTVSRAWFSCRTHHAPACAVGGFQAAFSVAAPQHRSQHAQPSSPRTQLWTTTYWQQLPAADRSGLRVPSTWEKRFFQCFLGLGLCLASPCPPFITGNPSCSYPLAFSGTPTSALVGGCQACSSQHLVRSARGELSAMPSSVSATPCEVLLAGHLYPAGGCVPHWLHKANPRRGNHFYYTYFLHSLIIYLFRSFTFIFRRYNNFFISEKGPRLISHV